MPRNLGCRLTAIRQKSYLEGYPVDGVRYNPVTKFYIRSKRDKLFVVHVEFLPNGMER